MWCKSFLPLHRHYFLIAIGVDMPETWTAGLKEASHIFSGILGPLQSVQRAEYRSVFTALQAHSGIHVGIDNLIVLRGVAELIDQGSLAPRFPSLTMETFLLVSTLCYAFEVLTR